ncbi:MAG: DNA mismatch repair protein MutS [Nakamurella sp.]
MSCISILFAQTSDTPGAMQPEPSFFVDLNLDQVVTGLTAGRTEYQLTEYYRAPLPDARAIRYRQQVFQDLERADLRDRMKDFTDEMTHTRQRLKLATELRHTYQRERWQLAAATGYRDAVKSLAVDLGRADLRSPGLVSFRRFLIDYTAGEAFRGLSTDTDLCDGELAGIQYCLQITGNRIHVTPYQGQADYGAAVQDTFARFKQGVVKDYRVAFPRYPEMNHIEAGVLDLVAEIYPDQFAALDRFSTNHSDFLHPSIARFDRELQFYLAYLDYIEPMKQAGLSFCYPVVDEHRKDVRADATFDIALARKLTVTHPGTVVCNDLSLTGSERIIVISGPNNGGKTTFARTFGQLHYLAELGVPIPGGAARLFLFDQLFTHFEQAEAPENLRGKLQDDLFRIHTILDSATERSIIIMNELFTSTTLHDAVFLGTKIIQAVVELDLLCVYVTFVDELAALGDTTVSMVSTVEPHNPTTRTHKIIRRPADGNAHAIAIAERFGLTYPRLKERLTS